MWVVFKYRFELIVALSSTNATKTEGIGQDQTASSVQSDLDLCQPQKHMVLPMVPKELTMILDRHMDFR